MLSASLWAACVCDQMAGALSWNAFVFTSWVLVRQRVTTALSFMRIGSHSTLGGYLALAVTKCARVGVFLVRVGAPVLWRLF